MFNDSFQEKKVQQWMFMDYTNLVMILMPFKGKIEQFKNLKPINNLLFWTHRPTVHSAFWITERGKTPAHKQGKARQGNVLR